MTWISDFFSLITTHSTFINWSLSVRKSCLWALHACMLQPRPTLCNLMDCSPPDSLSTGFSGKNTGVDCHVLLQGIFLNWKSNSQLPVSPALQADSLPIEPPGKPYASSRWRTFGSFPVLAITDKTNMNISIPDFVWTKFSFSLLNTVELFTKTAAKVGVGVGADL